MGNIQEGKTKSLLLKAMPDDVHNILIDRQAQEKKRLRHQFSLEQTIYKIIKEHATLAVRNDVS